MADHWRPVDMQLEVDLKFRYVCGGRNILFIHTSRSYDQNRKSAEKGEIGVYVENIFLLKLYNF